jgi:hypothetical protein
MNNIVVFQQIREILVTKHVDLHVLIVTIGVVRSYIVAVVRYIVCGGVIIIIVVVRNIISGR